MHCRCPSGCLTPTPLVPAFGHSGGTLSVGHLLAMPPVWPGCSHETAPPSTEELSEKAGSWNKKQRPSVYPYDGTQRMDFRVKKCQASLDQGPLWSAGICEACQMDRLGRIPAAYPFPRLGSGPAVAWIATHPCVGLQFGTPGSVGGVILARASLRQQGVGR